MQLGKKIATARKLKGLTQDELAELSQITVRTIQRIEADANTPQSFTLKAIAKALDIEYESLVNLEPEASTVNPATDDLRHFMILFNFSCFTYIIIPWVHSLVPMAILKKRMDIPAAAIHYCRTIIRRQVYWVITLHLAMLAVFGYNYALASVKGSKEGLIAYSWPFLLMYFVNAIVILFQHLQIRKSF
jgi:XRE family transcriptional regulator, regulator of sulfur utilization